MIEVSNLPLELDDGAPLNQEALCRTLAKKLGIDPRTVSQLMVTRKSVDARKKSHVHFVVSVAATLVDEVLEQRLVAQGVAREYSPYEPLVIEPVSVAAATPRPVVVGAGPAGLFAALYLAEAGLSPLLLEQGPSVEDRAAAIQNAGEAGTLDPWANIQFGEGGAGTFSDGKLTTGIKSPWAKHVLRWFVEAGAPEEILVDAKPHIGTDILRDVVRNLRQRIIAAGGEVHFNEKLVNISFHDSTLESLTTQCLKTGEVTTIPTQALILACGHSARDTFELLCTRGVRLEPKPFSVGVRIEHPQAAINQAQYGAAHRHPALGAADYKFSVQVPDDTAPEANAQRGVYTFCMCPGGEVVCAASEADSVVTNGMSYHARAGANANSALLVGVSPEDFGGDDPLAGVAFQRKLERAAFALAVQNGGKPYQAPAMRVGDFLALASADPERGLQAVSGCPGDKAPFVDPTFDRGVVWCDIRECLPPFVVCALQKALPLLDKKLAGFANPDAVMTAVESRSSSPVRIVRDECLQALVEGGSTEADMGYGGKADTGSTLSLAVATASVDSFGPHAAAVPGDSSGPCTVTDPVGPSNPSAATCGIGLEAGTATGFGGSPDPDSSTKRHPSNPAAFADSPEPHVATDFVGPSGIHAPDPAAPAEPQGECAFSPVPTSGSGLYPCGEGAGYAGGIMSAACDGMRVAAQVCETLRSESNA